MKAIPKVSVIMPVLNRKEFIADAIRSVRAQTYPNVELIVVDGGSTDGTKEILDRMGVRYLTNSIRNISKLRNFAVINSTGEFYCGCDSDDMLHPRYIEELLKPMVDPRVGLAWTSCRQFGLFNGINAARPLYTRFSVYHHLGGAAAGAMTRRRAFDDVGGYNESITIHEDHELIIRISKKWKCKAIAAPLYYYRVHDRGQMTDKERYSDNGAEWYFSRYPLFKIIWRISSTIERVKHPKRTLNNLKRRVLRGRPYI
jgi:glycosyltransferase involved in cell wall biosynthesis